MSFDLHFVALTPGTTAAAQDAVRTRTEDDARGFRALLAPYLRADLAEREFRAQVLDAAKELLVTSPFATFQGTAFAQLSLEKRVAFACSGLFEGSDENPAIVPISVSYSGNVRELVRFAAALLGALPPSVLLYDPQIDRLLDHDQVRAWSDV